MDIKRIVETLHAVFIKNRIVLILLICLGGILLSIYPTYLIAGAVFNRYFDKWGDRLVALEKKGLLSKEFGAAWQDILQQDAMSREAGAFTKEDTAGTDSVHIVDGIAVNDYPSLSIVGRLNEVHAYSNTITIVDRLDRQIAIIRTDHTRAKIDAFPEVLKEAIIAAEDGGFYNNALGFEYKSFVRAIVRATFETLTSFKAASPRGTSSITQQVAKLFVSYLDEAGNRRVSWSVDRKKRELRIAAALRKMYTPDEILEVYLNHCIASDYGLIGVKDIALGLFGKDLDELSDADCIYIARMVKWGRNIPSKVRKQCRIDMPRMGARLDWPKEHQEKILRALDDITFVKPKQIQTNYGHLVDLANEFWLRYLNKKEGRTEGFNRDMDIIDPNSLIRKKGNLTIRLTIDIKLQQFLEQLVKKRGYGQDTVIYTDVRIGSFGQNIQRPGKPRDTVRSILVVDSAKSFSEPRSDFVTTLQKGDTLVTNIRYASRGKNRWRRSLYFYTRRPIRVDGQYFAYCILDSRSGKLLAYYSKDEIGSRLACLLRNRVPNGSSTAKPILNAVNFDLGNFQAYAKWSDSVPVSDSVPWARTMERKRGKPWEVVFKHSAVRGKGYRVHNHGNIFEGCQYLFDHLATSNNIYGVESIYRLNRKVVDKKGEIIPEDFRFAQFFYRINALDRIQQEFKKKQVTGVRIYKELARIVGVDVDTMVAYGKKMGVSDSLYSIALGTLEMTLYEQAHLFNVLYNNDLIERPIEHPSLIIDQITMNNVAIPMKKLDTIKRFHPFADVNNIRPSYLGMHKRLISNKWDGLSKYDIDYLPDSIDAHTFDSAYSWDAYLLSTPLSNYAKSGTTDDVLRPYNVDVISKKRTNYGLWNAVVRVDMSKFVNDTVPDIRDLTIACIGECNDRYTGHRDGKTLHKFVSRDLLKKAGVVPMTGYFKQYEAYLKRVTPDSAQTCGDVEPQEILDTVPKSTGLDLTEW